LGISLFALFVSKVDLGSLRLLSLSFWARNVSLLLLFQLAIITLHSLQWGLILSGAGIRIAPLRIAGARFAGAAVSILSPSLSVGGEIVRAALVRRKDLDGRRLSATVALDKYVELATRTPFVLTGLILLTLRYRDVSRLFVVGGAAFSAIVLVGTLLFLSAVRGTPLVSNVLSLIARPFDRRRPVIAQRIRVGISVFIEGLAPGRSTKLPPVLAIGLVSSGLEVVQIYCLMRALGTFGPGDALTLLATSVLGGIVAVLPGNVGGMEALNMLTFSLIGGGGSVGLIYSLVLRGGQIGVVLIGFLYLLHRKLNRNEASGIGRRSYREE
jgi:uncharacterized protein (TIRG00374 family)